VFNPSDLDLLVIHHHDQYLNTSTRMSTVVSSSGHKLYTCCPIMFNDICILETDRISCCQGCVITYHFMRVTIAACLRSSLLIREEGLGPGTSGKIPDADERSYTSLPRAPVCEGLQTAALSLEGRSQEDRSDMATRHPRDEHVPCPCAFDSQNGWDKGRPALPI